MGKSFFKVLCPVALAAILPVTTFAKEVAHFDMEISSGKTGDKISGTKYDINGVHDPESVNGAVGKAVRFDGYSTYIDAPLGSIIPAGSKTMTASLWCAVETYPIVEIDVNTTEQVAIASCIDDTAKTGFGFFIGFDGKYSFKTYVGGWPLELKVDTPLQRYEWVNLTAVVDTSAKSATLYNNGVVVASSKANGNLSAGNSTLRIGRSSSERYSGPFCLTSFNGIVDEIVVWDEALNQSTIAGWTAEKEPDLTIPETRFADDPLRPSFHCMPGANWTNESHGMTYSNGRYHVFFQKNANGPYMARLHWGHLSSENLYDWREEPIALTPGEYYDIKGCWSGCVFSDNVLTGGKPSIIYTGVDYAKAVIVQATPDDDDLLTWTKGTMPIINGRPSGLSDDFRDPYFFRSGDNAYIIVGSSKGGVGTTTLHTYNPTTKMWSNDGKTFFTGSNAAVAGTFWEMPNVTKIGDKWLFTVTPLNTAKGVATLYWTGDINADGTFHPDNNTPANVELSGFAKQGYGLLSPTIYQHDGKTITLGIVPDKLPSQVNYDLGYAHTYSLPREWSLDSEGNLCQKPYSGLEAMRNTDAFAKSNFTLNGSEEIAGINGRAVELCGEFTVTAGKNGFTLLDDGASALKVYYDGASNEVVVDATGLNRYVNDSGVFDGYYHSPLPRQLTKGETVKLHVYFDHSILDIFVNDTWASSVRVFANAKATEKTTAFADALALVKSLNGWTLNASNNNSGVDGITIDANDVVLHAQNGVLSYAGVTTPASLCIYNLTGAKVGSYELDTPAGSVATNLSGFHIVTVASPSTPLHSQKLIF